MKETQTIKNDNNSLLNVAINSKTIAGARAKGLFGTLYFYNLIFKKEFLIIAITAGNFYLSLLETIFSTYMKSCLKKHKKSTLEYVNLSIDEILNRSKRNFTLNYSTITKVELKKLHRFKVLGAQLTIYVGAQKYIYGLLGTKDWKWGLEEEYLEQYIILLRERFPDLIVID